MKQQTATYLLRLPRSLKEKTAHFFNERQKQADMDTFKRILTRQGGQEPCEGDELVNHVAAIEGHD